jgi:hypothetical protein
MLTNIQSLIYSSFPNQPKNMTAEPQSIVHHVLRLGPNVVKVVSSINQRRRRSRQKMQEQQTEDKEISEDLSETTYSDSLVSNVSFHNETSPIQEKEEDGVTESLQTLNQNEFLSDVMIDATSELVFVHFFLTQSPISETIDERMEKLKHSKQNCRFIRVKASMAPYITSRLNVASDRPSVVALKNGKLINMMADFASAECSELDDWMYTVELLQMFKK